MSPQPHGSDVPSLAFGDRHGEPWQRGHYSPPEPGERLLEFDCCAFRMSSHHGEPADGGQYRCPLCAPLASSDGNA